MLQNSLTFSLLKKLWQEFSSSRVFAIMRCMLDFVADGFDKSFCKRFLMKLGDLSVYTEDSIFCRTISVIISFFVNLFAKIAGFVLKLSKGGIVSKFYEKYVSESLFLGIENLFALFCAAIFLIPHDYWNNLYGLIISFVLFDFYIFSLARNEKKLLPSEAKKLPLSIVFFIFSILLSVVISNAVGDSIRILFFFATSFMLTISVSGRISTKIMLQSFMRCEYFILLIMSLFAIVQRVIGVEADASLTDLTLNKNMPGRVFGTMDNPNNLAEYLTVFIPFGFAFAVSKKNIKEKLLLLCGMVLPFVAILLTYSRSGWIALACSVIVYIALYNYKLFPIFITGGIFALPFIPQSIYDRILTIGNLKDSSSSYRMDIWEGCLKMLKKYWFTGIGLGPGAFAQIFPEYATGETTVVMHSHMQFMEMMVEGGILLFLAYIILVFATVKRAVIASSYAKCDDMKHYCVAATASISGITLIGLFEYCWFYPRVMFAFFISVGLCFAISKLASHKD